MFTAKPYLPPKLNFDSRKGSCVQRRPIMHPIHVMYAKRRVHVGMEVSESTATAEPRLMSDGRLVMVNVVKERTLTPSQQ